MAPRMQDTVRLRNTGSRPFTARYDGLQYHLPADGGEALVHFGAACLWFGHPDAVDIDSKNRHRTDEVSRLRVRYGLYEKSVDENGDDPWDTETPDIECYTMDGTRLITVLEDAFGRHLTPETVMQSDRDRDQLTIEAMRAQMAQMQAQMEALLSAQQATGDSPIIGDENDHGGPDLTKSANANPDPNVNTPRPDPANGGKPQVRSATSKRGRPPGTKVDGPTPTPVSN